MAETYYKFINSIKEDSFTDTFKKVASRVSNKLGFGSRNVIKKYRLELSKKLDLIFKSTVGYGPFKGLRLTPNAWWGSEDRGSMLLGLYEKEVLDSLKDIPSQYNHFIDLGAADGYYGIGVLVNHLFEKSICYEISARGRAVIKSNAILNNVLPRVIINGTASKGFYTEIAPNLLERSVLLIDIEGAEFELFDEATFAALRKSIIIIEIHEWLVDDGDEKLEKLILDSMKTHSLSELTTRSRDCSNFPELRSFSDNDRWLVCSEGRGRLMKWLRFDPK